MKLNYLALAVPFFLFFMFVEYWIARRQGKEFFSFADSISNLNVGIAERLSDVFVTGAFYFVYDYLYRHFAFWHFEQTWYTWLLLLLFTDFAWYWYHRFGHEINLFWGLHVVHHQSPEFNYTASVRVTVFQAAARTLFWLFLPLIGFSAEMITAVLIFHGVYPFFVHTRTIGKLGWLDKNYGDVFIFWDKLFGTFKAEDEAPVFGLTKPLESYSFLWQHFHFLLEIAYAMRRAKGFSNKLRILFGKPDLIDPQIRGILERRFRLRKNRKPVPGRLNRYVLVQIAWVLVFLFGFILLEYQTNALDKFIGAGLILTTVINCGAILEQRTWIFRVEILRGAFVGLAFVVYFPLITLISLTLLLLWMLPNYSRIQRGYLRLVYRQY